MVISPERFLGGSDDRRWAREEEQIVLDFSGVESSL
jgi:hypothetical protein